MGKKILIAIAALLASIYIGFWATAPSSLDPAQYQILADKYAVHIVRDKYAVPHIFGTRDVDAAFGLAYAHAQDDFLTMQDVILVTRGTLSTLHGVDAAKTDYLVQFMGVWDVVDAGYDKRISQQTRDHAQAYADGVNYYASENPHNPGKLKLGHRPHPDKGKGIFALPSEGIRGEIQTSNWVVEFYSG